MGSIRRLSRITTRGASSSRDVMADLRKRRSGPSRPLVGVLVDDLGVDDIVVGGTRGRTGLAGSAVGRSGTGRGLGVLGVQRATDLLRHPGHLLLRGLDGGDVRAAERGPQLGERLAELLLLVGGDLLAALPEVLLGLVLHGPRPVVGLRLLT